jgi:hypothetical protein
MIWLFILAALALVTGAGLLMWLTPEEGGDPAFWRKPHDD